MNEPQTMQFKVAQLLKDPIGTTRSYAVDEAIIILDDGSPSRVYGDVTLLRTNRGVLVRGNLATQVKLVCSRCLLKYDSPLSFRFEEEFLPLAEIYHHNFEIDSDDAKDFIIKDNHILDITEAARQYAILSIPMKPLCRVDCSGLIN
jgi:uncharacterized protein